MKSCFSLSSGDSPRDRFLAMLPRIRKALSYAFRHLTRQARREAIQECLASAWKAFARLVERGKESIAYATPLAMYAAKQYRDGRRVAGKVRWQWGGDVVAAGERGLAHVASLGWQDVATDHRKTSPADLAAFRLDFASWLQRLPDTLRRIANCLALGERTKDIAAQCGVTPARISQIRRELEKSWNQFQRDAT
jgi:hypothetical protein